MSDLDDMIRRVAARCGDCGKPFQDLPGGHFYVRQRPARLICPDCEIAEKPQGNSTFSSTPEK